MRIAGSAMTHRSLRPESTVGACPICYSRARGDQWRGPASTCVAHDLKAGTRVRTRRVGCLRGPRRRPGGGRRVGRGRVSRPGAAAPSRRRRRRRDAPDVGLNAAFDKVRDPKRRREYDEELAEIDPPGRPGRGASPRAGRGQSAAATPPPPHEPEHHRAPSPYHEFDDSSGRDGTGGAGRPPGRPSGSVLDFGRHIGWSIGEIARVDPGYLVWLEERREGRPYLDEIDATLRAHRVPRGPTSRRRRRARPTALTVSGRSPARSASPPPCTSAVAAARSGPGSRSLVEVRDPRPDPRQRLAADPGARAPARAVGRPAAGRAPAPRTSSSIARIRSTPSSTGPRVAGRDRAHRDVVLLVGARRDRVGRRRMGQDLVLRGEGGGRVLVDHHPGVDARGRRRGTAAGRRSAARRRAARSAAR